MIKRSGLNLLNFLEKLFTPIEIDFAISFSLSPLIDILTLSLTFIFSFLISLIVLPKNLDKCDPVTIKFNLNFLFFCNLKIKPLSK